MRKMETRKACNTLVLVSLATFLYGCDVDGIGNRFSGSHALSGNNTARGGLSYTSAGSDKEWSHTFFTCRGSVSSAAVTTLRIGKSEGNLPLTVIADKDHVSSVQLQGPDGTASFGPESCSTLILKPDAANGPGGANGILSGKFDFQCAKDGRTLNGGAMFHQCGR